MTRVLLVVGCALGFAVGGTAAADQWVDGYVRSDGTYVQGHHRSEPDGYKFNNYSSEGNINPYTGERGHKRDEYSSPSYRSPSYGNDRSDRGW